MVRFVGMRVNDGGEYNQINSLADCELHFQKPLAVQCKRSSLGKLYPGIV